MRRLQEVEEKVRTALAEDETVARTVRARRAWLILTNRRLLVLSATRRGHPREMIVDEPLASVQVERRWLWSKLERRLVIRTAGGRPLRLGLASTKGQKTRWAQASVMGRVVDDVHHWTMVAEITAEQARRGQPVDATLAHVHATALEAVTPADLARALALDPHHVQDVLEERFQIRVSKGAALKYTYTKKDRQLFDEAVKEKLFATFVDEVGTEKLVEQAQSVAGEWWESAAARSVESVLGVFDISLTHAAQRRAPIALWRSRFMWVGFAFAALTAILVVPPMVWRSSWAGWRDGTHDRPQAAIFMGIGAVAVVGLLVFGAIAVNLLS